MNEIISNPLYIAGIVLALVCVFFTFRTGKGFVDIKRYSDKLDIKEARGYYVIGRLGDMMLSSMACINLCAMLNSKEKFKLRVEERDGKFYPQVKFGSHGGYQDILVLRYGDYEDEEVTPVYNTRERAEHYCENVTSHGAFADKSIQIFAATNVGDLFGEDEAGNKIEIR